MPHEGVPGKDVVNKINQAPVPDAYTQAETPRDMALAGPVEKYRATQKEIIDVRAKLDHVATMASKIQDQARRESMIALGREDTEKLARLEAEKTGQEAQIVSKGGNPADYTVQ